MLPARRPYPDELATSAVLRCCRQFNVAISRLGNSYLGRDGWRPSFLAASPLRGLAKLFAMTPEDVLWNHTTFPYSTATMQARYYESALANAYGDGPGGVGLAAVTQNATSGLRYQRYCPQCAQEEFRRTQESFWHRAHNLPGVVVCLRHHAYLHESTNAVRSSGRVPTALPHESEGRRMGRGPVVTALLRLAELSASWLNRPRGPGVHSEPAAYRQLALDNGWLTPGKDVAVKALASVLSEVFTSRLLEQAGIPHRRSGALWAAQMLRPHTTLGFSPVKHAVLRTLLGGARLPHQPLLDHQSLGPSASGAQALDAFYSREARKELRVVIAARHVLTTEAFLRRIGCWGVYKHRKDELPRLREVVREFRGSTATVKRLRPRKTLYESDRRPVPDNASMGATEVAASQGDPEAVQTASGVRSLSR
jgi:hypothetical protein